MATKRITRREVQSPDAMQSSYERAQTFVESHWKTVLAAVLGVLAVAVGVMFVSRSRAEAEERAHVYWLRAQQDVSSGEYAAALEYANTLVSDHGGSLSGQRAHIIRADALAGLGRNDEALAAYREAQTALPDDEILMTAARRGEATMLENLGQHAQAAEVFEPLAEDAVPEAGRLFDLKNAARNLAMAGDTARAISIYQTLVDRYDGSDRRVDIQEVHLAKVAIAELQYRSEGTVSDDTPAS